MQTRRKAAAAMGVTALVTAVAFVLSDTPDKKYLNPLWVDVAVLGAGLFLIVDAWLSAARDRLVSVLLRSVIGVSIVVIHVLQFVFDLLRRGG